MDDSPNDSAARQAWVGPARPGERVRLLMVINKAERELEVLNNVARELRAIARDSRVLILEYRDQNFFAKALQFEPSAVLIFPLTSRGLSLPLYALKLALDCRIITLQAEGIVNYRDDSCYRYYAGMDSYGPDLIDLQMMWSQTLAHKIGGLLLESGRIASLRRVIGVGYPKIEAYLGGRELEQTPSPATADFLERASGRPREGVLFFATGFSLGEYSVEDLINAKDIFDGEGINQVQRDDAQRAVTASRNFRDRFVAILDDLAPRHPEVMFVIKSHPVENILYKRKKYNPYHALLRHLNVAYYDDTMSIKTVLLHSGIIFHFGSSLVSESYLAKTPSVFVESSEFFPKDRMSHNPNFNMHDMGWPSSAVCDLEELAGLVDEHCRRPLKFFLNEVMAQRLEDGFDVLPEHLRGEKAYRPLRRIAEAIIRGHRSPALACRPQDAALVADLKKQYFPAIMAYLALAIERSSQTNRPDKAQDYLKKVKQLRGIFSRGS